MSERLRPRRPGLPGHGVRPRRRCTTPPSRSSSRATPASTTTALVELIADRIAFVPRYRQRLQRGAGPPGQPRLGRRPGLRPRLPRTPLRAAASGHHGPAARARRAGSSRGRWTATGRCGRSTSSRASTERPGRGAVQVAPDPGRRHRDRRPGPGAARRQPRPASRSGATSGGRAAAPSTAPGARARRRHAWSRPRRCCTRPRSNTARLQRTADAALARVGHVAAPLSEPARRLRTRPVNGELSQQRRFVAVRTDLDDYRRIRRVHGGTVNDVVLATVTGALRGWLMTRGESIGGHAAAARDGADVGDRRRAGATSLGTQIAGHLVDLPIGEPSPVVRLHQVSPTPSRRTARPAARSLRTGWRASRASRRRPSTPSAPGSPRPELRRGLPPLGHQRARPAVPALRRRRRDGRDLPGPPAAARPRRWRSASRRTTAASSTASPPTGTRCPTSTSSASASLEALDELVDSASDTRPAGPARAQEGRAEGAAVSAASTSRRTLRPALARLRRRRRRRCPCRRRDPVLAEAESTRRRSTPP